MRSLRSRRAFTLIEIVVFIAIASALIAVAIPKFATMIRRTREGNTKARLGTLRSALSLYASDNMGRFPTDRLGSLAADPKYLKGGMPVADIAGSHPTSQEVTTNDDLGKAALEDNDLGGWSYWNSEKQKDPGYAWGAVWIGCTHTDTQGSVWTFY
ncbi:MAG: type II secretion system protein [Elusimicrobiota bacterium]|jgi:type II secretory pathway pseudopilin PulG